MRVIVEYNKYNTQIINAEIPVSEDTKYTLKLNESLDKVEFSTVIGTEGLEDTVATLELTEDNVLELSRLFSNLARGIEINK